MHRTSKARTVFPWGFWSAAMVAVVAATGCKQNPFPETGRMVFREPPKAAPVLPPLVLDVPESTEVWEGGLLEIPIGASVPLPGRPLVAVQGLPQGAVFDAAAMKITWTPDFNAANDPRDQSVILKTYPLRLTLSSSEDPVTVTQRSSLIVVRDYARPMTMNIPTTPIEIKEGTRHEQIIKVESEDYPEGPFEIQIRNMPVGVIIERDLTNLSQFKVIFTPSYREVNVSEIFSSYNPHVDRQLDVSVFGPRGTSVSSRMTWRIVDVRETAIVLGPTKINQGLSASFSISAEDPNGEEPPTLTMFPRPAFGLAELRVESTNPGNPARGVNPSAVASFRWTQIPPDKIGTTQQVTFQSCVRKTRFAKDLCITYPVEVTFERETRKAPVVQRKEFPLGSVRYVREQEKLRIPVVIKDGEYANLTPTVEVTPASVTDEVKWNAGFLEIEGKKAGLKQFTLLASSAYGTTTAESFLVEVLPWSWSSVIVFGDGASSDEVRGTVSMFENAQVASPVLQLGDPRLLVLRKSVFVGTTALSEPGVVEPLETLATQIPDVVVSTPLLARLEGALGSEIEALGVSPGNRVTDLAGSTLALAPGSPLTPPTNAIRLAGKLTAESANPTPLTLNDPQCKPLLVLQKQDEEDLVLAASCKRKAGGTFVVAGFELADIQTSPADSRILKRWLTDLVKQ